MATDLGSPKFSERAANSPLFTFLTRVVMWLGAAMAGLAVYIFTGVAADVKSIAGSMGTVQTDMAVVKRVQSDQSKDIDRLNAMFFGRRQP